jgi:hypothetical protein
MKRKREKEKKREKGVRREKKGSEFFLLPFYFVT